MYETGKLFAATVSDATNFGKLLSKWETNPNFNVIKVDVPSGIKVTEFHAHDMKAVSVDNADLDKLKVKGCH